MVAIETRPARPQARTVPLPLCIDVPGLEIGPEDTVVDIGCGQGDVCVFAGQLGAAVVGIDISRDAILRADEAMSHVPARWWRPIVNDCDPIPLPDGCATVVICTEVLEHVEDPAKFLAEVARVGAPGARFVLSVPDPASEGVMRAVAPDWYWKPPFHSRVLTHEALDNLIEEAGLVKVARASRGFHQSVWWAIRFAIGARIGEPTPDHPALQHWDAAWIALVNTPDGHYATDALDNALPKSQLVLARKPDPNAQPEPAPRKLKRLLREGVLRIAGFDLQWSIRRAKPPKGDTQAA